MANLLWLQGGACSGNTMSFLNAEAGAPVTSLRILALMCFGSLPSGWSWGMR